MSDYTVGETVYFLFTTRRFTTGAPFQLAGTPGISAYENDSATQITAGITLGVDHDGVTGLNLITVVATGGNGFEAGKDYHLVITTGTVDSVSVVGEVVGRFTLNHSSAFTRLGAPAGASIAADLVTIDDFLDTEVAAIKAKTDNLPSDPADASDVAALITAVDDFVDTEVAAIKAKTDLIPGTQDGLTWAQSVLLGQAVLLGKASGLGTTTAVYRSTDDGEDRVTATVDADGNRTAVTLNTA